jgi:hypothetical protein
MTRAHGLDISKFDGFYHPVPNPPRPVDFIIQRLSYVGYVSHQLVRDEAFDILSPEVLKSPVKGAYHYAASYMGWKQQADFLIGLMDGKYDFWAWDVEKTNNTNTPEFINGIIPALEYLSGVTKKPGLYYFNPDMWNTWLKPIQNDIIQLLARTDIKIGMWVAHYWNHPNPEGIPNYFTISGCANMPRNWTIWQYAADSLSPYGHAYGTDAVSIDTNVFNGTVDELHDYFLLPPSPPTHPAICPTCLQDWPVKCPSTVPIDMYRIVNCLALNIRSGPGVSYPIVGAFDLGDLVAVIETSGNWARHSKGWSSLLYLQKT